MFCILWFCFCEMQFSGNVFWTPFGMFGIPEVFAIHQCATLTWRGSNGWWVLQSTVDCFFGLCFLECIQIVVVGCKYWLVFFLSIVWIGFTNRSNKLWYLLWDPAGCYFGSAPFNWAKKVIFILKVRKRIEKGTWNKNIQKQYQKRIMFGLCLLVCMCLMILSEEVIQLAWHFLTNSIMQMGQRLRPNWAMDNCPGPPPNAKTHGGTWCVKWLFCSICIKSYMYITIYVYICVYSFISYVWCYVNIYIYIYWYWCLLQSLK